MALTKQSSKISSREWSSEADSNLAVTRTSLLHDKRYHWHDVKSSTNGFHKDHFVGESTYATVYEGILADGTAIAVKRLKRARSRAKHDFEADVVSIARASHKNVAKLLGYSSTFFEKVFVFHYFPKGSLDAALHGDFVGPSPLDWDKRKAILFGVAEGLDYLHSLKPAMLHGRLTSRNVMLHQNCTPQLIDYHIGHPVLRNIPTQIPDIEWAMGYMAPELGVNAEMPCVQSDCYSFGFLLLEIVSGQRPWRLVTAANSAGLKQKDWVLASSAAVESLVDPQMTHLPSQSHPPLWEVQKLLELAVLCMADQPSKRPMMSDILSFLREELLMTRRPAELQDLFIELMVGESDGQHSVTMESEGSSRSDDLKQLGADELSWGAQQPSLEEALEACLYGHAEAAQLLTSSEMIRPEILAQAFVNATNPCFVDVVAALIQSGVDVNLIHRFLLRSAKPSLHANLNCTPSIAAITGRQAAVVRYLLEAGARTGVRGRGILDSGRNSVAFHSHTMRPVEYWESKGEILKLLLQHLAPDSTSNGRQYCNQGSFGCGSRCRSSNLLGRITKVSASCI